MGLHYTVVSESAEYMAKLFAKSLGCDVTDVTCMRSKVPHSLPCSVRLLVCLIVYWGVVPLPAFRHWRLLTGGRWWLGWGCGVCEQPVDDVVKAQNAVQNHIPIAHPLMMFLPWTPTVDNDYVIDQPLAAFQQGKFHNVPLMIVRRGLWERGSVGCGCGRWVAGSRCADTTGPLDWAVCGGY